MKKLFVIVLLLVMVVGCGKKTEEKNVEITYDSLTYFQKVDSETLRIYVIFENTSNVTGKIENLVYGAVNYNDELIANNYKKVNIKLKSGEQRLVIVDLKIGEQSAKTVFITPFNNDREELKSIKSTKKEKEITDTVQGIDFYESDEAHFQVKLNKPVDEGKNLKFIVRSLNSNPLCLSYSKTEKSKDEYEFDCEYKLGEAEFIYELFID